MFNNLKITTIKLSKSLSRAFLLTIFVVVSSCAYFAKNYPSSVAQPLTEREILFEKAKALMIAHEYAKAEDLFLSLTGAGVESPDKVYDQSIWNLALINDKKGKPDKAILLALQILNTKHFSNFKVKALLMKNYFRIDNPNEALRYKKMLDAENPKLTVAANDLYYELVDTLDLNYDHLLLQELAYVNEIQKYLVFVMEQNDSSKNEKVTDLLISIYDASSSLLTKDVVQPPFKKKLAIALLDNLRRFDLIKLNDTNLNQKTVVRFSKYAEQKQNQITDWLYR